MQSERGHARSFAMGKPTIVEIQQRTNELYDTLIRLKQHHEQVINNLPKRSTKQKKNIDILKQYGQAERGVMGICVLRSLSTFDVGTSFMTDSLHNVYRGAFVSRRLLKNV